jgi:type IV secretion system protein VirB10
MLTGSLNLAHIPTHTTPADNLDRANVSTSTSTPPPAGLRFVIIIVSLVVAGIVIYSALKSTGIIGSAQTAIKAPQKNNADLDKQTLPPKLDITLSPPTASASLGNVCGDGRRLPPGVQCPPDLKAVPAPLPFNDSGPQSILGTPPPLAPAPKSANAGEPLDDAGALAKRRREGSISFSLNPLAGQDVLDRSTPDRAPTPAITDNTGRTARIAPVGPPTSALDAALSPTTTPSVSARVVANPTLTLAKGSIPNCTLNTAIRTGQPGFAKCTLAFDVYSMDGRVVLMEKGTVIDGEYQTGISAGQTTIFVLWNEARTPNFVTVNLASPATDGLGRAGIPAYVDNKFVDRFAGAIFFSLFEDVATAATQRSSSNSQGGNVNLYNSTQTSSKALVEEMLKQGSTAKREAYKNQGEAVNIYIARDVDFSTVYRLEPRGDTASRLGNVR